MRARVGAGALALAAPARAGELDLDDTDGLNTTTIAKKERDSEWFEEKRFGAETVAGHNRSFAKPEGIRSGNFIISPEAGAAVVFDDNIFSTDAEKVSDIRSVTRAFGAYAIGTAAPCAGHVSRRQNRQLP